MPVSDKNNRMLHSMLPIDEDEKILAVYKHHWFAYASIWLVAAFIILAVMAVAIFLVMSATPGSSITQHSAQVYSAAAGFSVLTLLATLVPIYLRSQESLVLTEEAILQILQPSLFASKTSQLSLQHIADVSVRQDFFGSILGFGKLSIETPGEQDNYEFLMVPTPQHSAREIIQAHENFDAALQAGRMPTTLGASQQPAAPQIDPQQYQQFLQYQQMVAQQQSQQQAAAPAAAPQPQPIAPADDESTPTSNS